MSASEKLKALDFDLDTDAELFTCLRPQIVAVVEVDEEFIRECERNHLASDATWPPTNARDDIVARKFRALAALDEALP